MMEKIFYLVYVVLVVFLAFVYVEAHADNHLIETRYCGEPARNADGTIKRNRAVVRAFEKLYPLPKQYSRDDWQIDHVIPIASGGCDVVRNMQWLPKTIKTCTGTECKDRWERGGIYR